MHPITPIAPLRRGSPAEASARSWSSSSGMTPAAKRADVPDPHPYRVALESRDAAALAAALHPDVIFDTPAFEEPIRGRENVLAHLRLDEEGLVRRITVTMRPIASLQ